MAGNSFGDQFRITTFGESHGVALGVILDGCPAGIPIEEAEIQRELDRRKPGQSLMTSQRKEPDQVKLLSGTFEGKTTGTPISMVIYNEDQKSKDYQAIQNLFRPGHADFTYQKKYGLRDYRGGGRASARETVSRVASGAVAKKMLGMSGIKVTGYLRQLGPVRITQIDLSQINQNPFFSPDSGAAKEMARFLEKIKGERDSIGALVEIIATGVPAGLGEPVFDKLDADLARAMMSINAVKGVEIGDGFKVVEMKGSENSDPITPKGFKSNHAGGILGGISNGDTLIVRIALKPTSSIAIEQDTIDIHGKPAKISTKGRHDPCVGIRAVPIAEAMMALTLADHWLRSKLSRIDPLL
ncbi:MAG: chorismate synthase [Nitrospirae bacterium]|nr:chorismate synthase [Nitrospirota bacterium]MBI3594964.1 chorismate synthase [Nitrospirota bacterium]